MKLKSKLFRLPQLHQQKLSNPKQLHGNGNFGWIQIHPLLFQPGKDYQS